MKEETVKQMKKELILKGYSPKDFAVLDWARLGTTYVTVKTVDGYFLMKVRTGALIEFCKEYPRWRHTGKTLAAYVALNFGVRK